jgi:hypothetical protein
MMKESKDTTSPVLLNPRRVVKGPLNLLLISKLKRHTFGVCYREKEKGNHGGMLQHIKWSLIGKASNGSETLKGS